MNSKYFAGVGSRETPDPILRIMTSWANKLYLDGFGVTTGGARGSDDAFYQGIIEANSQCHEDGSLKLFLPRKNFNGHKKGILISNPATLKMAREILLDYNAYRHYKNPPRFITENDESKLSDFEIATRQFHTRNVFQVLQEDLKTPVKFVGCWTPCGSYQYDDKPSGGTAIAINLATALERPVPVINLQREEHLLRVCNYLGIDVPAKKEPEIDSGSTYSLF